MIFEPVQRFKHRTTHFLLNTIIAYTTLVTITILAPIAKSVHVNEPNAPKGGDTPDHQHNSKTTKDPNVPEEIIFNIENLVNTIAKSNKKNIVYNINNQLNEFYDNQTVFVHNCATRQLQETLVAEQDKRVDKLKSYIDYFYFYKQVYMELLNGYKNLVMNDLIETTKTLLRNDYLHGNGTITYEEYVRKDKDIDDKMIFVNKAFRSSIINHVLNVEVAMFTDFFHNHKHVLEDERLLNALGK